MRNDAAEVIAGKTYRDQTHNLPFATWRIASVTVLNESAKSGCDTSFRRPRTSDRPHGSADECRRNFHHRHASS